METWSGSSSQTQNGFLGPTVPSNSGTFHLLPSASYMTCLQRDGGRRRMSSRKVWSLDLTSVVEINWDLISFSVTWIPRMKDPQVYDRQRAQNERCCHLVQFLTIESEERKGPPTSF